MKQEKIKKMVKEHKTMLIGLGCVTVGIIFGYEIGFKRGNNMSVKEFSDSLFENVKNLGTLSYRMEKYPNLELEARIRETINGVGGMLIRKGEK